MFFHVELFDSYDPEVGFGGAHGRGRRKQDPPIERELYLTLEEVFKGCTKKMKISRRVSITLTSDFIALLNFTPVLITGITVVTK